MDPEQKYHWYVFTTLSFVEMIKKRLGYFEKITLSVSTSSDFAQENIHVLPLALLKGFIALQNCTLDSNTALDFTA